MTAQHIIRSKQMMRREVERRRADAIAHYPHAAAKLAESFIKTFAMSADEIVAGYMQRRSEMDPFPILNALHACGVHLALPVIVAKQQPLLFRRYAPGDVLQAGILPDIMEPAESQPSVQPTVLLVPLLAFDARGYRLGYGGGFYDRTLNGLRDRGRLRAVGLAFGCQQVPEVPIGDYDAKLDAVITETGVLQF